MRLMNLFLLACMFPITLFGQPVEDPGGPSARDQSIDEGSGDENWPDRPPLIFDDEEFPRKLREKEKEKDSKSEGPPPEQPGPKIPPWVWWTGSLVAGTAGVVGAKAVQVHRIWKEMLFERLQECMQDGRAVKEMHLREQWITYCCHARMEFTRAPERAVPREFETCQVEADKIYALWDRNDEKSAAQEARRAQKKQPRVMRVRRILVQGGEAEPSSSGRGAGSDQSQNAKDAPQRFSLSKKQPLSKPKQPWQNVVADNAVHLASRINDAARRTTTRMNGAHPHGIGVGTFAARLAAT